MKAGWEVKALGEVCLINPPKQQLKNVLASDDPVSFVPMSHLGELESQFSPQEDRKLGEVYKGYTYFADDDVIVAKITPCFENGKMGVASGLTNAIGFGSSEFVPIRGRGRTIPKFLFYYLLRNEFRESGARVMSGAVGHKRVPKNYLEDLPIPLPPLDEQKRIVAVLDAAFEGLTRARTHVETNLQNARELFESALLSIFGSLTNADELRLLKEVSTTFGRGKSKHRPRNDKTLFGGHYPFIQTGDVRNSGHLIETYTQTYNEKGLAQSKLWPAGTVCITIAANIAETGVLAFDACFPDSIIGMVPDENKTQSKYIEYLLQFFQKRLKALGAGAAQDNINLKTFETEYFPFPSLEQQAKAVLALDAVAEKRAELETRYRAKLQNLEDLRQSLLRKAFAGELT